MQTLINIELGYVKCDIDGDGYNRLTVMRDDDVEGEACFSVSRETKCYGDQSLDNLTRQEALAWVEDQHFLVATRYARKQYEQFVRELKAGKHDPAPKPSAFIDEPIFTATPAPEVEAQPASAWRTPPGYTFEYEGEVRTEGTDFLASCTGRCCSAVNEAARRDYEANNRASDAPLPRYMVRMVQRGSIDEGSPRVEDLMSGDIVRPLTFSVDPTYMDWLGGTP